MTLSCVVLAAGLGTRMNSKLPKVLHKVCGIPMIRAVINTAEKLRPDRIVVVVGRQGELIKASLDHEGVVFALQREPKGTGHALRCARPLLGGTGDVIIVLNGDTPLLRSGTIKRFLNLHKRNGTAISVLSFRAQNPDSYGRIVRDGSGRILSIIEERDADAVQRKIDEVNSGVYALNYEALDVLDAIKINKGKGEYYLTDIVAAASRNGLRTAAYCIGSEEDFMGVNTRGELYKASGLMRKRIVEEWMHKGVIFLDTESVFIHPDVSIGKETTIYPNVYLEGRTTVGRDSLIYPNVRLRDSSIGNGVVIWDSTIIEGSRIKDRASVGPFARIRPGSEIGVEARIGNFVELKKAAIGKGSKASHLSYIGDATLGRDVNVGAGTITCNYDGTKKHKTEIGDNVFIGSDTQLIAPVHVGKGAYIGAGSTITRDVPAMSLAMSRVKQWNIEGWARKRQSKAKNKKLKFKGEKEKR
jgi:bifunctional UDP-N-acetylglucosamine pyrophosphorylase/glucosamine-1-phosphate N-acetyltransferase